jgi:hypothetical protein
MIGYISYEFLPLPLDGNMERLKPFQTQKIHQGLLDMARKPMSTKFPN